jgi:hypothetical protein
MPQKIRLKGSVLLLVVGIFLVVFGAFGLLGALAQAGAYVFFPRINSDVFISAPEIRSMKFSFAILLTTGIVDLVFGIFAIRFRNRSDKIKWMFVLGIIMMIVQAGITVYSKVLETRLLQSMEYHAGLVMPDIMDRMNSIPGFDMNRGMIYSIISIVAGFILSALYILGAVLNKQSVASMPYGGQQPYANHPQYMQSTQYGYGQQGNPYGYRSTYTAPQPGQNNPLYEQGDKTPEEK